MASIDKGSDFCVEASLFKTAAKLWGSMAPTDCEPTALNPIILNRISNCFEPKRRQSLAKNLELTDVWNERLCEQTDRESQEQHLSQLRACPEETSVGKAIDMGLGAITDKRLRCFRATI